MTKNTLPTIAVSSCLLGNKVRYDGRHKLNEIIVQEVSRHFQIIPFCPECDIGLGTPRTPIALQKTGNEYRAIETANSARDLTDSLIDAASRFLHTHNHLDGFIFKSNSPSCGITKGIFACKIQKLCHWLPIVEESAIDNPKERDAFYQRVYSCHQSKSETL